MALEARLFTTHKALTDFVQSRGVNPISEHFDPKNNKWILYYDDFGNFAGSFVSGPGGKMALSKYNRSWWTKGSVEASLPPAPENPGHVNQTYDADDRVWRLYELALFRLAIDLKIMLNNHFGKGAAVHGVADTRVIDAADATTLPKCLTLLNQEKELYNEHHIDDTGGIHGDVTDPNTVTAADATDLASAKTLALDLLDQHEAHRINLVDAVHGAVDNDSVVTAGGVPNQFSYVDVYVHGTWGGGDTVNVYGVNAVGVETQLANAAAADTSAVAQAAKAYMEFRVETAALHANTEVDVDIVVY